MLYLHAVTDHNGLNKILHGAVLLIDLVEDDISFFN